MLRVKDSDYKCPFDKETVEKARRELGETADTRLLEVKNLRKRLEKVPGLKARSDINFLLRFLRVRKYNQERAFQSVKYFYETKRDHPDVFDDLKPSRVKHLLESNFIEALEKRDKKGCAIIVMRAGKYDHTRYPIVDALRALAIGLLKLQEDEETQVHGMHLIMDIGDVPLGQLMHWTPSVVKLGVNMLQAMVPWRVKQVDYINVPVFFQKTFALVKFFLSEKLSQRVHLNDDTYQKLHSTIDPEHLPTYCGGKLEPGSYTKWMDDLLVSDKLFEEENKYGYLSMSLENKGKETSKEDAGLQGLGGTFKKLEV